MAKKETTMGDNAATPETETPKLTPQEKRELFASWDAATQEIEKAEQGVIAARNAQSLITKLIFERVGKGPFSFKGYTHLRPVKRTDKEGKVSYLMRGPGTSKVEKI